MPYPPSAEELIDFSVSWDCWRQYCQDINGRDPGDNEIPQEPERISRSIPQSIGYSELKQELDQQKGLTLYLQRKLNEHIDTSKVRQQRARPIYTE